MSRKHDIPYQLLSWHEHVANVKDKLARQGVHLPYREVLQEASATYHGKGRSAHSIAGRSAHSIAGRSAHSIAGRKPRAPPRRKAPVRGRGVVSDIAHGIGSVADMLGFGMKKRKAPAKRKAPVGARRVTRKAPMKRGRGVVSDIAHGIGSVADLLGFGMKKRKAPARRPVSRRGGLVGDEIAGKRRGPGRPRKVGRPKKK